MTRIRTASIFVLAALLFTTTGWMQSEEVIAQAYRTVNVRSGPGTQYAIIGQLTSGNEVPITGRSDEESNWLRITFDAKEGWVAFFTVTVLGKTETLPIVEPRSDRADSQPRVTPTPTPLSASGDVYASVVRRVNVRSGPGLEYRRIGILEPGSSADISGRTPDNEWLQIDFNGLPGWVAYFVVDVSGTLAIVPTVEFAEQIVPEPTVEIVTRYNVNLRQAPVVGSPIIAVVPFNTHLEAEARLDSQSTWLQVRYNGRTGWLLRTLVTINDSLRALPIETQTPLPN